MSPRRSRGYRSHFDYPAFLDCKDGKGLVPCRVTNMSAEGACIYLPGDADLPKYLTLVLSERGGVQRECQVMWLSETEIGLAYRAPGVSRSPVRKLSGTAEPDNRSGKAQEAYRGPGQRFAM